MAFRKIVAIAACISVAYGAPQYVVNNGSPFVRTVGVAHAQPLVQTVAHTVAQPALVRTVAQPTLVRTVAHAAPVVQRVVSTPVEQTYHAVEEEITVEENPQYNYGYSVSDAETGDYKDREEARDGDVVRGSYSVADPDGRIRHVEYTADAVNGFQARVTYNGEPGPVAIPFDAPARTETVAAVDASPVAVAASPAIIDARTNVVAAAPAAVRTFAAPAAAVHTTHQTVASPASVVRTVASPLAAQTVRTNAFGDVHALHNSGLVRTATVAHAPAVVSHVASPLSTVRTNAFGNVHALHNSGFVNSGLVRTATVAQPAFHAVNSPVFANAGLVRANNFVSAFPQQTFVHV